MRSDGRRICCAVNYSAQLTFRVFKGSLEAISVAVVRRSSCSASARLSVSSLTDRRHLGDEVWLLLRSRAPAAGSSLLLPFGWIRRVAFTGLSDPWAPLTIRLLIFHLFKHNQPLSSSWRVADGLSPGRLAVTGKKRDGRKKVNISSSSSLSTEK